jgi:uncharacterized LabA/DUF88 family protein
MAGEPPLKNALAFVDGQSLYRHAKDAFGHHHPNYDPVKLHRLVCERNGWRPTLVRFYTGVPSVAESPMWSSYWSNRVLAMKRAGIDVTTRPIRYHKERVDVPDGTFKIVTIPQEKGIDVRLALDLVRLARTGQFDVAVLFSQDSDLAEVVADVKSISKEQDRWISVVCAFPAGPKASAHRGIEGTRWIKLLEADYNACLDPKDYRTKPRAKS